MWEGKIQPEVAEVKLVDVVWVVKLMVEVVELVMCGWGQCMWLSWCG